MNEPVPDAAFGPYYYQKTVVTPFDVTEHIENLEKVAAASKKLLRPGGLDRAGRLSHALPPLPVYSLTVSSLPLFCPRDSCSSPIARRESLKLYVERRADASDSY